MYTCIYAKDISLCSNDSNLSIVDAVSFKSTPGAFKAFIISFHVALGYFSCHILSISSQQASAFPLWLHLIVFSRFISLPSNNSTPTLNQTGTIGILTCLYNALRSGWSVPTQYAHTHNMYLSPYQEKDNKVQ